jgi:hypothetical protein
MFRGEERVIRESGEIIPLVPPNEPTINLRKTSLLHSCVSWINYILVSPLIGPVI